MSSEQELWLSRASLRRDAPVRALAPLLLPDEGGPRLGAMHRLLWTLFADGPERERDFLWREDAHGRIFILSRRPPVDAHSLFDLDHRPFEPELAPGDRLRFSLRANAVVARGASGTPSKRHDLVMDALKNLPTSERAAAREGVVQDAARGWLARIGPEAGFEPDRDRVFTLAYDRLSVPRGPSGKGAVFGIMDIEGEFVVREPSRLLERMAQGFGRARSFGCGLMLIRRA